MEKYIIIIITANKGELELDQFMNLIFGDSEVLNVNLKDVPRILLLYIYLIFFF